MREIAVPRYVRTLVQHLKDSGVLDERMDANETAFLEREVTYQRAQVREVQYAELMAEAFIPMATDIPADVDDFVYKVLDFVGEAKVIANAADDLPAVDVSATEVSCKVYTVGDSYQWTKSELAKAARLRVALPDLKVRAAARAINQQIDKILASGKTDSQSNLITTGLLNNANVEGAALANVISGTFWQQSTSADTMLNEMNAWVNEIIEESNQLWVPNFMIFAPREYNIIASKKVGTDNDKTILKSFLENNPHIQAIASWWRCTGAGDSSTNRAVVYKLDSEVLEGVVNQQFEQEPPQLRNLATVTNCTAKSGGVQVYHPRAMRYVDQAQS